MHRFPHCRCWSQRPIRPLRYSGVCMPTLPELQRNFMDALLDGCCEPVQPEIIAGAVAPNQRLAIYANNAETNFIESLRLSFPAIRRLVGDAYFTQCARAYRAGHPSRS